jgi:hypothetical protein
MMIPSPPTVTKSNPNSNDGETTETPTPVTANGSIKWNNNDDNNTFQIRNEHELLALHPNVAAPAPNNQRFTRKENECQTRTSIRIITPRDSK